MKITREINGIPVEIELTWEELHQAHFEMQDVFDYQDVIDYISSNYEDYEKEFSCIYVNDLIEKVAKEVRRLINDNGCSQEAAMNLIVPNMLREHLRKSADKE